MDLFYDLTLKIGNNSTFFYELSRWRKRIGIKANIEMLYLVDEMYGHKNKTITLIFGKPIQHSTFDKRYSDQVWAEKVKEHVYQLGLTQQPNTEFNY